MTEESKRNYDHCEAVDLDTFFKMTAQPETPPGVWRKEDIFYVLDEMDKNPKRYPTDRRAVSLVNTSWEGAPGASPAVFIGFQRLHPGEHLPPHKHNSVAIYYWVQGSGRGVINGEEIRFKQGDVTTCPAWNPHEFFNDGEEDLVMLAVHDLPILAQMRALFWEEPIGQENIQRVIRSEAVSWNAQESEKIVENLNQIRVKTKR